METGKARLVLPGLFVFIPRVSLLGEESRFRYTSQLPLTRRSLLLALPALVHASRTKTLCGVEFAVLRNGNGPRRYLFIHGNEDTARIVTAEHLKTHPGTGYAVTGKNRNVTVDGLLLDPNRMFSRIGAEKSLRNLNPSAPAEQVNGILDRLDREREPLLKLLTPGKGSRLVALHNNREYSVLDEVSASDATSIKQPELPRSFFLCTDSKDFAVMKQSPYNVILQNKPNPDDGSLSRLAARRGFRYINLECALGEQAAQVERVNWLEQHLET